ncbi:hypothetical protein KY284_032163 [Solanum tuberosum]|nr:hypothetical protein KY284_032163 [Solanum tuberosum]
MEWKKCYLDVILVPLGFMISLTYHIWLWHKVKTQPLSTIIGTNANGRRLWVSAIIKDNEKKNILAVQTFRNTIMGSTLMATTSILLCSGLAAVISSTYSVKKPLNDAVYGGHALCTGYIRFDTVHIAGYIALCTGYITFDTFHIAGYIALCTGYIGK